MPAGNRVPRRATARGIGGGNLSFSRPVALFALLMFLAIGAAATWVGYIENFCLGEGYTDAGEGPSNAKPQNDTSEQRPSLAYSRKTAEAERKPKPIKYEEQPASGDSLICSAHLSDILISLLTACLVIVGGFQAWWLWQTVAVGQISAQAARDAAEALPILERAYIFFWIRKDNIADSVGIATGRIRSLGDHEHPYVRFCI